MRLPVDSRGLQFIVATPPKPVQVFGGTGEVRTDKASGKPLFSVRLMATTGTEADMVTVKLAGPVDGVVGEVVSLSGLTVEYWELDGRSGVSFRADTLDRHSGSSESAPARKVAG